MSLARLGERTCRAERRRRRVPCLGRVEDLLPLAVTTGDEETAVGQEGGAVELAGLGERPCGPKVLVTGSQTSADARAFSFRSTPPTTRTRPSGRRVAVWNRRPSLSEPVGLKVAVTGSQTSAEARAPSA